jgi:hypothetical protein
MFKEIRFNNFNVLCFSQKNIDIEMACISRSISQGNRNLALL